MGTQKGRPEKVGLGWVAVRLLPKILAPPPPRFVRLLPKILATNGCLHPPPCAPILTLSHGPHPACAARVRNLNAAPGACSPHDMSRPVSMSACGLAMEPSNSVHTTPTQVTHYHHHNHHHHHHPPLAFTPPTHPDDRPRRAEHFIAKVSAGDWHAGAARVEERERRRIIRTGLSLNHPPFHSPM